ncbi:MAG TPA: gamma-glutamyl-gamma-aminobutyrate hydrolase family protein [Longimicrobiales bacterium]|nr:gamma-glutamyl-gamma-aminobutyrate hydrolase family protein [Longimicrobiales bacterium]
MTVEPPLYRPLRVALTTTVDRAAGSHARPAVFLYTSYIHALEQVGLTPVLVTPSHSPAAIGALLDSCCGLVLSGGEDVDPSRYGEDPSPALGAVEPTRDEMELRAIACALEQRMPIFGICRGLQVLNVHFGGTLYQDLATERPSDLLHEQAEGWDKRSHGVTVSTNTLLHDIVGAERLRINSFHHQAVKRPGRGLAITALADDGLAEAIECPSYPWLLGVQWHPERNEAAAPSTDPDRLLFLAFREAVHRYAGADAGGAPASASGA